MNSNVISSSSNALGAASVKTLQTNGIIFGFPLNSQVVTMSLRHMHDATMLLPKTETEAYREAVQRCTQPATATATTATATPTSTSTTTTTSSNVANLVEQEASALHFLQCENFNAWSAANRRARYWENRKRIFGAERFCLPILDISGKGALNGHDLEVLKTGFLVLLSDDDKGHPVLLYNRQRLNHEQTNMMDQLLRIAFYIGAKAAESSEVARRVGIVYAPLIGSSSTKAEQQVADFHEATFTKELARLYQTAIPIQTYKVHLFWPGNDTSMPRNKLEQCGTTMLKRFQKLYPTAERKLFISDSLRDLQRELEQSGMDVHAFPQFMGGSWSYDTFRELVESMQCPELVSTTPMSSKKRASMNIDSDARMGYESKEQKMDTTIAETDEEDVAYRTNLVEDALSKYIALTYPPLSPSEN